MNRLALLLLLALPALAANIAPQATITASSQNGPRQAASKAVDGVVDGYPGDWTREWVTTGQGPGAWLELAWPAPQRIDSVTIHDRINLSENVTSGRLEFDAGAAIAVGALPNDGAPLVLTFPARTTSRLRFVVVSTSRFPTNIGLAEIKVDGSAATSTSCACDPRYTPSPTVGWDAVVAALGYHLYIEGARVASFPATLPLPWPALQRYGSWPPGAHLAVQLSAYDATTEGEKSSALDVCAPCVWPVTIGATRQASYDAAWASCPCPRN